MVVADQILGNAAPESGRSNSGDRLDPVGDGSFAIGNRFVGGIDRTRGLVSGHDADFFWNLEHARFVSRRCSDTRRRTRLFDFPRRDSGGRSKYFHRFVYGIGCLVSDVGRRRIRRCEVGARMVRELGARVGRIREGLRRAHHHGGILFNDHDGSIQNPRPCPGLAERRDQMVAPAEIGASSLVVRDVRKSFPAPDNPLSRRQVLDGVSFSLAAGELISLIGPSGCGKSTLLRLVAGLDSADSGDLLIGAEPITAPNAERGLVFQDPNLFPWLTVRRNIQAGLVAQGVLHEKKNEVDEFMRLVGLEIFANVYPHHLSGGMAQRAALARALINHPKILLLDEPLGALDAFTRMRMQDEVLRLWEARRTTMLLVTHDIDEAIYMSDRIMIMTPRPGRIERTIPVELARPRQRDSGDFLRLRSDILKFLHFAGKS